MDDLWLYTTPQAQILFNVKSEQTVRNWAKEFAQYLSIHANPDDGGNYRFTVEDMAVLALVSEHSAKRTPFVDIHAILQSGQRGDKPTVAPDDVQRATTGDVAIQMRDDLTESRLQVIKLEGDVQALQQQLTDANLTIARLETKLEMGELDKARERIEALIKQVTRLEVLLEIEREKYQD